MKPFFKKIIYTVGIGLCFGIIYFLFFIWGGIITDLVEHPLVKLRGLKESFLFFVFIALVLFFLQFQLIIRIFPEKKFLASLTSFLVCYISFWWLFMGWLLYRELAPLSIKDLIYLTYIPFPFVFVNTAFGFISQPLFALIFFLLSCPFIYYFLKEEENKQKRLWKSFILAIIIVSFLMTITGYITWPC